MRHTDMRLTMNVYTDPRMFDMNGAVEKLPAMVKMEPKAAKATGTDDTILLGGVSESVSSSSARIGYCSASIGKPVGHSETPLTLVHGSDRQQKTPSGFGWGK